MIPQTFGGLGGAALTAIAKRRRRQVILELAGSSIVLGPREARRLRDYLDRALDRRPHQLNGSDIAAAVKAGRR